MPCNYHESGHQKPGNVRGLFCKSPEPPANEVDNMV